MRSILKVFFRFRYLVRPDIRQVLDGFALFFAISLFFCLTASAVDWHNHRIRAFDKDSWWYPIYTILMM
jgi:hypothetical protein